MGDAPGRLRPPGAALTVLAAQVATGVAAVVVGYHNPTHRVSVPVVAVVTGIGLVVSVLLYFTLALFAPAEPESAFRQALVLFVACIPVSVGIASAAADARATDILAEAPATTAVVVARGDESAHYRPFTLRPTTADREPIELRSASRNLAVGEVVEVKVDRDRGLPPALAEDTGSVWAATRVAAGLLGVLATGCAVWAFIQTSESRR